MEAKDKIRLKLYGKYLISRKSKKFNKYKKADQRIIIGLAADYGNLGDVAITHATTQFMKNHYPEADIIDFPISETFSEMKSLKSVVKKQDIIVLVGGGNMGDMYDDIEYCRQFIIQEFPDNKIISFPQTIDISKTSFGKKARDRIIKVYSKHSSLIVSARETKSYKNLSETLNKNIVMLVPDIVLSLNESKDSFERTDIMFCLRSDSERAKYDSEKSELMNELKRYYNIKVEDTHIDKNNMSVEERKTELNKKWNSFKKSKLIITDRLHGMIFAAITGTPCIAFDNSNKKISGVYNLWLTELPYVQMASDYKKNIDFANQIMNQDTCYRFDNIKYKNIFVNLLK